MRALHWMAGLCVAMSAWGVAQAATVTWRFQGEVIFNNLGGDAPPQLGVGNPLVLWLSFNPQAPIQGQGSQAGGIVRTYNDPDLSMLLRFGSFQTDHLTGGALHRIIARDNFPDPSVGDLIDGLSWSIRDASVPSEIQDFGVILRGPTLDLLDLSLGLPSLPDPRWTDQRTSLFQFCQSSSLQVAGTGQACDTGLLQARLNSVALETGEIPEPAGLALTGLALLAGGWRLRRAA